MGPSPYPSRNRDAERAEAEAIANAHDEVLNRHGWMSRSYVDLFALKPNHGERFIVQSITQLTPERFARIYNERKPAGLENTDLIFDGDSFRLKVDNEREFPILDSTLATYQGRIVLHGTLRNGKENVVKISIGPDETTVKLPRKQPIVSVTVHGNDIVLGYRRWSTDPRVRLRLLASAEKDNHYVQRISRHQIQFSTDEVKIDRQIGLEQKTKAAIQLTFTEAARHKAWKYWTIAQNHNERKGHQGDIGEAVACIALGESGYEILERHTVKSELFTPGHQSRGLGRDVLATKEEEYYVAEVKHWTKYTELAMREAEAELLKFAAGPECDTLEKRIGAGIKGALAIELEWSYRDTKAILNCKYIGFSRKTTGGQVEVNNNFRTLRRPASRQMLLPSS